MRELMGRVIRSSHCTSWNQVNCRSLLCADQVFCLFLFADSWLCFYSSVSRCSLKFVKKGYILARITLPSDADRKAALAGEEFTLAFEVKDTGIGLSEVSGGDRADGLSSCEN